MDPQRINRFGLVILGICTFLFFFLWMWLHGFASLLAGFSAFFFNLRILLVFIGGILLHEGLHGLSALIFTGGKFRKIKFGFNTEMMAPYAHCAAPVKVWQYIVMAGLPGILMGILPAIYALITKEVWWYYFGFFFTWTAAGDIISIHALLKHPLKSYVLDHPDEMGFIILHKSG